MKSSIFFAVAGAFALALVLAGCDSGGAENSPTQNSAAKLRINAEETIRGLPADYFPMTVGTKWVYKIELGEAEPLYFEEVSWPMGKARAVYATRGRYLRGARREGQKTFVLEMKVKQRAAKQGPLEYPQGVELEVLKDDLGIYGEAKQLFWAVSGAERFSANQVVIHSPDELGAPTGPWGQRGTQEGHSIRLLFFGERPGMQIGIGKEPKDRLLFDGIDHRANFGDYSPLLHFVRSVEANDRDRGEHSYLDSAFSEHTWFAKGKGLVRLEQKVEGQTSMVWSLVDK